MVYQALPYTVLVLYPAAGAARPDAAGGGAHARRSPLKAFFNVVVPALRNTIVATFIMVFVFALGSYLLPQILGRPQHWTLSVLITDQADLPVEHAVRRGHGGVPGAGDAGRWWDWRLLVGRKESAT